jgi:hypothetical protein
LCLFILEDDIPDISKWGGIGSVFFYGGFAGEGVEVAVEEGLLVGFEGEAGDDFIDFL